MYQTYRRTSIEALLVVYSISFIALCIVFHLHLDHSQIQITVDGELSDLVNPVIHNYSNSRSEIYELIGDIRIHGNSSTVWVVSDQEASWTTKPFARQETKAIMSSITEMKIVMHENSLPTCTQHLHIPAILFSCGGYAHHAFHAIGDVIIPLYFTSHHFNGSVMFLISDFNSSWISRYNLILEKLSDYDPIDLGDNHEVLCFSRVIIGLDSKPDELGGGPKHFTDHSMIDFRRFIRDTYLLERDTIDKQRDPRRLLIISREKTRRLMNLDEIYKVCRGVGFEVDVREINGEFSAIARYVNSFDVIVGVHGAGLANMIFLPENAVVVQIVPFALDYLAQVFFQLPAMDMKLRYFNYTISWNESSLANKYSSDDRVCTDFRAIVREGWHRYWSIYMKDQDVKVDVDGFQKTIAYAFELLCGVS